MVIISKKQVCVIGLGTIGLPLACLLATSGFRVSGVDTEAGVVASVCSGHVTFSEPDLQTLLGKAVESGNLTASKDVSPADIYIVAVPTRLDRDKRPDIRHVYGAIEAVKPHLRSGNLVLIESTCPIGTTETIEQAMRQHCPGIHVAYCPERVFPSQILYELIHNDRIVGGVDEASTQCAITFYRSFVSGKVLGTHARTAEAVKLAENTYRDVNIAFANELSMIADRVGVDVQELIGLANKHPRVKILNPGPGVGGYCITVNPWFLASSAPELAILTTTAREVNLKKVNWVVQKVRKAFQERGARVIACLGFTYKADVSDTRESPSLTIVEALEKEVQVLRVDPHVPDTVPLYDALTRAEMVVCLVGHREFLDIPSEYLEGKVILDFAGIFPPQSSRIPNLPTVAV